MTAGLTGMDPNVKICIYGDCNAIRFFHQSHNTVRFGGLFTLKQWIFSSLKHDPVPRENKLYCFYVKNPPKRIALWDRENSQCFCSVTSRKINLDFCSAFEIRLLVESSYNKTNDLF